MEKNTSKIVTTESILSEFIFELLRWANPDRKKQDEKLNACAVDFIKLLTKDNNLKIKCVKPKREKKIDEKKRIDICADVDYTNTDKKYLIIIENKTLTGEHSKQLKNYEEWGKKEDRKLICIYLKTGTESKYSTENIKNKYPNWTYINRRALINFLKKYNIEKKFYADFLENLEAQEKAEKAFKTKNIKDWDYFCRVGFFHYLDSSEKFEKCFWEHQYGKRPKLRWLDLEKGYLQIEKKKQWDLYFKICVPNKTEREMVKDELHKKLEAKAKEFKLEDKEIIQVSSKDKFMAFAIVEGKYWLGDENKILNVDDVIDKLKKYEKFFKSLL